MATNKKSTFIINTFYKKTRLNATENLNKAVHYLLLKHILQYHTDRVGVKKETICDYLTQLTPVLKFF
jgi:hypothetical protein